MRSVYFFLEDLSWFLEFPSFSCLFFFLNSSEVICPATLASVIFLKQVIPDWKQVESSHPICRTFHFLCRAGCCRGVLPVSHTERTLARAVPTQGLDCQERTKWRAGDGGQRRKIRRRKGETEKETARQRERDREHSERKWERSKWFPDWVHSRVELLSEGVWNVTVGSWNLDWGICSWDFFIRLLCACFN